MALLCRFGGHVDDRLIFLSLGYKLASFGGGEGVCSIRGFLLFMENLLVLGVPGWLSPVKRPPSAQVMISRFVSSNLKVGYLLPAQGPLSTESPLHILCPPLSSYSTHLQRQGKYRQK